MKRPARDSKPGVSCITARRKTSGPFVEIRAHTTAGYRRTFSGTVAVVASSGPPDHGVQQTGSSVSNGNSGASFSLVAGTFHPGLAGAAQGSPGACPTAGRVLDHWLSTACGGRPRLRNQKCARRFVRKSGCRPENHGPMVRTRSVTGVGYPR